MSSLNSAALAAVVRSLEGRVEQLIADHKRLNKLNHDLLEQRDELRADKREMQERILALEKELALREINSGLAGAQNNNQRANAYINRLMREVDNCITLLSSPGAE